MSINPAVVIGFVFAIVFPLALVVFWKKKTGQKLWTFIAGAICFFFFAYVLEALLHQVMLGGTNKVSLAVLGSPVLFTIYTSFAAGFFEETGRLFGFKVLLGKHQEKECAVAYGIGHGGIEAMLIVGLTYGIYLIAGLGVTYVDEATTSQIVSIADSISVPIVLVAAFERVSAVIMHVGLSMIMFVAIKRKKLWLYPVSICMHALADVPACLYKYQVLTSLAVIEICAFVMGVLYFIVGKKLSDTADLSSSY